MELPMRCAALIVVAGVALLSEDAVQVQNGFSTGEAFLEMPEVEQRGYAMGFVNGLIDAPFLTSGTGDIRWVERCVTGMSDIQVREIIRKYMKEHPERWHEPLNITSYSALVRACPESPVNRPQK